MFVTLPAHPPSPTLAEAAERAGHPFCLDKERCDRLENEYRRGLGKRCEEVFQTCFFVFNRYGRTAAEICQPVAKVECGKVRATLACKRECRSQRGQTRIVRDVMMPARINESLSTVSTCRLRFRVRR